MENTKPKPHPHAEAIKAWADGAKIQIKTESGKWVDVAANWPAWSVNYEYRVKPEEPSNEPWKPKKAEYFFHVTHSGDVRSVCGGYSDSVVMELVSFGNCFRTKEEAIAAAERVKAALKGDDVSKKDAEIKKLTDELETLKIRCKNMQITKDQLIASRAEMDSLTEGETALIKAMRKVWKKEIPEYGQSVLTEYGQSVLVYNKEGSMQITPANLCVAFITDGLISDIGTEDAIIDALKQIKKEQKLLK